MTRLPDHTDTITGHFIATYSSECNTIWFHRLSSIIKRLVIILQNYINLIVFPPQKSSTVVQIYLLKSSRTRVYSITILCIVFSKNGYQAGKKLCSWELSSSCNLCYHVHIVCCRSNWTCCCAEFFGTSSSTKFGESLEIPAVVKY